MNRSRFLQIIGIGFLVPAIEPVTETLEPPKEVVVTIIPKWVAENAKTFPAGGKTVRNLSLGNVSHLSGDVWEKMANEMFASIARKEEEQMIKNFPIPLSFEISECSYKIIS